MKISADKFVSECRIIDFEDRIDVFVSYEAAAAKKLFNLSKGECVDALCATYDKASKDINSQLDVIVLTPDGYDNIEYTMFDDEKLIFKEELIANGYI